MDKLKKIDNINFTELNQRNEDRVDFNSVLYMYIKNKKIKINTLDISLNGIKIEIDSMKLNKLDIFYIEFNINSKKELIPYTYINHKVNKKNTEMSLKIKENFKNEVFFYELDKIINLKKKNKEIEVNNIVESTKIKHYEQTYIESLQSLPMYFTNNKLKYVYSAGKNDKISGYFQNEKGENILSNIVEYLKEELFEINLSQHRKFISFMAFKIEKNNKIHFFIKLINDKNIDVLKLFAMYGLRKSTFRIFKIDTSDIKEKEYILNNTLPKNTLKNINLSNYYLTKEAEKELSEINKIGLLSDITDVDYKINIKNVKISDINLKNILKYKLEVKNINEFSIIEDESNEVRKEDRFEANDLIKIKIKNKEYSAKLKNMSVNGLMIELLEDSSIVESDKISIFYNNINIKNVLYRVVKKNKNILSLKLLKEEDSNNIESCLKKYINDNINNLTPVGLKNKILGLSKGLRNIYIKNHLETPLFFKINKENIIDYTFANSKLTEIIFNEFNYDKKIERTLTREKFKEIILKKYKSLNYSEYNTFKYFVRNDLINNEIIIKEDIDFNNSEEKISFLDKETSFCFKIILSKINIKYADKYFRDEIEYISKLSNEKAKAVIDDINKVSGVLNIQNITEIQKSQLILFK